MVENSLVHLESVGSYEGDVYTANGRHVLHFMQNNLNAYDASVEKPLAVAAKL